MKPLRRSSVPAHVPRSNFAADSIAIDLIHIHAGTVHVDLLPRSVHVDLDLHITNQQRMSLVGELGDRRDESQRSNPSTSRCTHPFGTTNSRVSPAKIWPFFSTHDVPFQDTAHIAPLRTCSPPPTPLQPTRVVLVFRD